MAQTYDKKFAELYWHNRKAIYEFNFMDAVESMFDSVDSLAIEHFRKLTVSDLQDDCETGMAFRMMVDNQVAIMAHEAAAEGTRL